MSFGEASETLPLSYMHNFLFRNIYNYADQCDSQCTEQTLQSLEVPFWY